MFASVLCFVLPLQQWASEATHCTIGNISGSISMHYTGRLHPAVVILAVHNRRQPKTTKTGLTLGILLTFTEVGVGGGGVSGLGAVSSSGPRLGLVQIYSPSQSGQREECVTVIVPNP